MNMKKNISLLGLIVSSIASYVAVADNALEPWQQAQKTEVWSPVPKIVSVNANHVPSDATILFDGTDLSSWETLKGGAVSWAVTDDYFTVNPGMGDIKTKQSFCDVQLHFEWKTPTNVSGMKGQQRNNSGIFFQQRYEIQILDSYQNETYANGQVGSVYKQTIPLVNAMKPTGEWQTYDIIYTAPRFNEEKLITPGYITLLHNGVLAQNHVEIQGKTEWIGAPSYKKHGCAPLQLQDHGNLVSFRNVWLRELNSINGQ